MAKEGLYYYTKDEIDELISGGGGSTSIFMKKSVYDTNDNGIVDNAERVNGHTVGADVPFDAKFTDTTYEAGNGISINNGVITCTLTPLPEGIKFAGSTCDLYNYLCSTDLSSTSSWSTTYGMFNSCKALTTVPLFDTSHVTDMQNMFQSCEALTTVPLFNTSNVDKCAYMFSNCFSLVSVPQFDLSNCTDPGAMFSSCRSLVTVPQFNWSKVTSFGGALSSTHVFNGCTSLSNESLNNILASLAGATSFSGGVLTPKTLKFIGLTQAQAEICTGLSNYAAFTAAGWSTGY